MLESYRELLDIITRTPVRLREAALRAGEPPAGEWGAAEIVAHLAATEQLWIARLNQLLREPEPLLRRPSPQLMETSERLVAEGLDAALAAFNAARGEIVSLLMGLSLRDWERSGIHETRGELSIADVVEDIGEHDAEHLAQLEGLATPG